MQRTTIVALCVALAAATACSGDVEDPASVPELDAQGGAVAPDPAEANVTVDTQVVRMPGERDAAN